MLSIPVNLGLPRVPSLVTSLPGPHAQAIIERDRAVTSPSYTRDYPLVVARGEGCMVEDVDGNVFLDMTAGIAVTNTGHAHPEVIAAIQAQSANLLHMSGTDFYYEPMVELAEKLASRAPFPAGAKVFFTNSGAESNEGAIKLARYYTKRSQIVAFLGAFHGRTYGAMSLTASKVVQRQNFGPFVPGVTHIPYGTHASLDYLEKHLFPTMLPPQEVAAIVVEAIQGEGGYIVPEDGFLQRIREICDRYGILMVVDEVQSGMGRTGCLFAIEHWCVMPDIITTAKGIASGLPLGAILSRPELMTWPPGAHATTFGGNPVACAAGIATLKLLEGGLIANALQMGELLQTGLTQLHEKFPRLSLPRGKGLMVAVDLYNEEGNLDRNLRDRIIQEAFKRGLLLLGCGKAAIRFCPPLVIDSNQIHIALDILSDILSS
ncbi:MULTISPECIES: acetyl ornithine aminotransferase family protein [unclassified Tolypothrix]|uniref:acetyl ornithine aminotransferase family protein n=1 Tax=unclassified Tolypothrix TaxID=2649714 RepID=UPI0005EABD9A|nr:MULTISPECIES: acetyl ornithine aminotransferase family protein [unclassified Tolypothrix]BAY89385.1 4-aminobutyrate aminotransferase [Microchaete diplosiphon NIES-3275]EKF01910.1 putative 4-aminobutyrate transaminase [Tolypothrix sp. PCC 7601]MBE9087808.1 acetyl ornithine aminotransferase family protein [Tolypothrix sp. LEGE 11397]UYD23666.1 acetyl ornithine aminotransferase family protein [Tolypothrix sp. PCC 7712]UYD34108.1 acetyl ornithine aminotransferase family protein [Tolypothrix sp.